MRLVRIALLCAAAGFAQSSLIIVNSSFSPGNTGVAYSPAALTAVAGVASDVPDAGGATSNESPQCPTMTSAGADRS